MPAVHGPQKPVIDSDEAEALPAHYGGDSHIAPEPQVQQLALRLDGAEPALCVKDGKALASRAPDSQARIRGRKGGRRLRELRAQAQFALGAVYLQLC